MHTIGRAPVMELSRWIGPLSPAFAALASSDDAGAGGAGAMGEADRVTAPAGASDPFSAATAAPDAASAGTAELRSLFHSLNNQLGVILTYAELLEAKAQDEGQRARAAQIVSATMDALGTTKDLRRVVIRG